MANRKVWPMNQEWPLGDGYGAQIERAAHFAKTSGGTGVDHPTASKVVAQEAPDNTVLILPGGGSIKSPYPGAEGQSYYVPHMEPITLELPPTGSSSAGRHDLLVMRMHDPEYGDYPPGAPQRELTPEEAAQYDFWYPHIEPGFSSYRELDYPHYRLAHIRRAPNTTIITDDDIHDLRKLANPQKDIHMFARNLYLSEEQSLHSAERVWPEVGTHTAYIPEYATHMYLQASWGTVRSHEESGSGRLAQGWVQVHFIHPDGERLIGQQASWNTSGDQNRERFNIVLGDQRPIPAKFRDQDVTVEFRGRKTNVGPNIYMDGDSSISLIANFKQEIE